MSIIGNNVVTSNFALNAGKAYLHNLPQFHFSPTAEHEVTKFFVRQNNNDNTGNTAQVGIYDVTLGAEGAVLIGIAYSFSGDNADNVWKEVAVPAGTILLAANKTYAVAVWSDTGGWACASSNGYVNDSNLRRIDAVGLPATFDTNDTAWHNGTMCCYAEAEPTVVDNSPTITNVNGGNSIADGDVDVPVTGENFAAIGNTVTISLTSDINDVSAVTSVVSNEGSTSTFDIAVNLPVGVNLQEPVHVFVNNGTEVTAGFPVDVTPPESYLHTLTLDLECSSSDFALGMTAKLNGETALLITAVSTLPTTSPQFQVTFTQQPAGSDVITVSYDATVGDIVSTADSISLASFTDTLGTTCP